MCKMGKSTPKDLAMYNRIKKKYQDEMPNSAYRSGLMVKAYKAAYKKKYGDTAAYSSNLPVNSTKSSDQKKSQKMPEGLTRWFAEKWRNEHGGVGYDKKNKLYRPTKRVTPKTPTTWKELTPAQIRAAKKKKLATGRVDKFVKPASRISKK